MLRSEPAIEEGIANLVRAFLLAGAKSVVASLWAASGTYTITLTRGLRPQPKTGVLFPDCRFKTGIVTCLPVNQQSSIINQQSNGHAILLGGFHHGRRRIEEHSAFSERAKVGYSSLSVNVDCWRPAARIAPSDSWVNSSRQGWSHPRGKV
jgi:hypothetical protein